MIDPHGDAVRNQRRIANTQYARSERQREILLARTLADVFNVSFFYGDSKAFWNEWGKDSPSTQMNAIKESAKLLGIKTLGELIGTSCSVLGSAQPMTAKGMAFLLDFAVAFGLEMIDAPPAPLMRTAKPAEIAS